MFGAIAKTYFAEKQGWLLIRLSVSNHAVHCQKDGMTPGMDSAGTGHDVDYATHDVKSVADRSRLIINVPILPERI